MPAAEHGTRQRYKDGCHCDPCKAAEAAYKREQRKRRNARKLQQPEGAPPVAAEPTSVVPFKPRTARDQVAAVEAEGDSPESEEAAAPAAAAVHGSTSAAVLAELAGLKTMETRPGLVAVALALARVLDSPAAVAQWPSAAHRLSETLDKLRKGSEGKGGRLASVQRMTGSRKATG